MFFSCKKEKEYEIILDETVEEEVIKTENGFILNNFRVHRDTFRKGDNFSKILSKNNLGNYKVREVLKKVKDSLDYYSIPRGKSVLLLKSKTIPFQLEYLVYEKDKINYTIIGLKDSITVVNKAKPVFFRKRLIADEIKGSFTKSLAENGIKNTLSSRLAKIYEFSLDFFKLKKGDRYAISVTERFINDSVYDGIEKIEGSFFENKNKRFYAFPYIVDTTENKVEHFDEKAKGLKTMFLKSPLDFFRISSKFNPKRFHPVQLRFKPHNGTDYAAPHGTPIKSTAAGVVERTGFTTGNGNFVKVKHNKTYATQYLHMSKILVKNGQRVAQGQVIGKVGSTGLATGPHVCYRFWKNGKEVDPFAQKLPNTEPLQGATRNQYFEYIKPIKRSIDSVAAQKFNIPFDAQKSEAEVAVEKEVPVVEEEKPKEKKNKKRKRK
jgi:murein DD-endopeptidase MepM/ murein hydrolase activator NlpD